MVVGIVCAAGWFHHIGNVPYFDVSAYFDIACLSRFEIGACVSLPYSASVVALLVRRRATRGQPAPRDCCATMAPKMSKKSPRKSKTPGITPWVPAIAVAGLSSAAILWHRNRGSLSPPGIDHLQELKASSVSVYGRTRYVATPFELFHLPSLDHVNTDIAALTVDPALLMCGGKDGYGKSWNCVRRAPLRERWPSDQYGFTASESQLAAELCTQKSRAPYSTEDREAARAGVHTPPRLSRSPLGFHVLRMPDELLEVLRAVRRHGYQRRETLHDKHCQSNHFGESAWQIHSLSRPSLPNGTSTSPAYFEAGVSDEMKPVVDWVAEVMRRVTQAWVSESVGDLELVHYFGLREYTNDAMMINHRDGGTRLLGLVLQIDQQVNEGWPLYIEDKARSSSETIEYFELFLQPGTMLLYESARLNHGRPRRLQGASFVNAFLHFKPIRKSG